MSWKDELKRQLQSKREKLLKGIESAKKARDAAPSAMESHSDTSRSESERLMSALETELKKLDEIINSLPEDFLSKAGYLTVSEWRYVEVLLDDNLLKLCLVPEGIGGEVVNDIRLISTSAPLGKIILNKKKGDTFTFNEQQGKIEDIQ